MTAFVLQPVEMPSRNTPMPRLIALLLLLLPGSVIAPGCQSSRLGHVPASFRDYHEAGVAVIGPTYEFDATTTVKCTRPVLLTLKSNQAREYEGREIYPDFLAFAEPSERGPQAGEIEVKFSEPIVQVHSGWALLIGTSPMGGTRRVRAVGEGTVMIIEVDISTSPAMHRVYLVGDDHSVAHIYPTSGATAADLTPGTYGEIQDMDSAMWTPMGKYDANPQRKEFVRMALEAGGEIVGK